MRLIKLAVLAMLIAMAAISVSANESARGWCEIGSQPVVTNGLTSQTTVQQSVPQCTVTVYLHGTTTIAPIFSDNLPSPTVLGNPFYATSVGQWQFYAANGRYDIVLSGGGLAATVSYPDIILFDCTAGGCSGTGGGISVNSIFVTSPNFQTSTNVVFTLTGSNVTASLLGVPFLASPNTFTSTNTFTGAASFSLNPTFVGNPALSIIGVPTVGHCPAFATPTILQDGGVCTTSANAALKPAVGQSIQYVTSAGDDTNDGLSWGTSKLTLMAGYDALPLQGGTIEICAAGGAFISATSTPGQGIWIMGPHDPNYASPPAGWRHFKPVYFYGACGNDYSQQGHKPFVDIATGPTTAIWLSSNLGSVAFENLEFRYPAIPVQIGVDSNGNQTANSGWIGATFENIATENCNSCTATNAGPGWLIGGGDTFDIFVRNSVSTGNGNAAPGSDLSASFLIKPASLSLGTSVSFDVSSTQINGPIIYYEGNAEGLLAAKDIYSESITNGGGATPYIGTVIIKSIQASWINVHNVFTADATGNVVDVVLPTIGSGSTGTSSSVVLDGFMGSGVRGTATVLQIPTNSPTDPLVQGETGFWAGRVVGYLGTTQRAFAPTAVRFTNLAATLPSSWSLIGTGDTLTTGITAPDGTTGAGQMTSSSPALSQVRFYDASIALTVGDSFVFAVARRIPNGAVFADFSATNNIIINGAGDTVTCNRVVPPFTNNAAFVFTYQLCTLTAVATSPAEVIALDYFSSTQPLQVYAPTFIHIPAAAASQDEVYELANNLNLYDHSCAVGTVCGLTGQALSMPQFISTVAIGTPPLVVTSTTNVPNLNASSLNGATFAAPGAIGGTTASPAAFTTVSATGQVTSTQSTGTAPFVIASTTPVANLTTVPATYNHSGTQVTAVHLVQDTGTLAAGTLTVTLTGAAVFTSSATYACSAVDTTTPANVVKPTLTSGTSITFTGTTTDVFNYSCIGS